MNKIQAGYLTNTAEEIGAKLVGVSVALRSNEVPGVIEQLDLGQRDALRRYAQIKVKGLPVVTDQAIWYRLMQSAVSTWSATITLSLAAPA